MTMIVYVFFTTLRPVFRNLSEVLSSDLLSLAWQLLFHSPCKDVSALGFSRHGGMVWDGV
jgi:hypothetical protein